MKQSSFFTELAGEREYCSDQLRLARLAAGKSFVDLGKALGVTRQYAHKLENNAFPSTEQISQLAELLNVSEVFFFGTRKRPIEMDQCHFRSLRSSTQTVKKMIMAQVEMFEDNILSLLDVEIEFPEVRIKDIGDLDLTSTSTVESVAESFRRDLGVGIGPISNIVRLAESVGCLVMNLSDADEKVDAFSIFNKRPLIVRNTRKLSPCRLRFDIAHEIGHLIMHRGIETGCRQTEEQANKFASALLMPRSSFSSEFPRMRGRNLNWDALEELKVRWGVSLKAIIYRAGKLGLISPDKVKTAYTYLNRSGQIRGEERGDGRIIRESPEMIQRAIETLDGYASEKLLRESGLTRGLIKERYLLHFPEPSLKLV